MKLVKEFQEFAVKGNVVDMAVGVVIGAAFGKIVTSLVGDLIMPTIGVLLGGIDFTNFVIVLKPATTTTPAVVVSYGKFLQTIFDFIIIAASMFTVINLMNKLKRRQQELLAAATSAVSSVTSVIPSSITAVIPSAITSLTPQALLNLKKPVSASEPLIEAVNATEAQNQRQLLTEIRDLLKERK
jgi:large conductance mechanosensitive channel